VANSCGTVSDKAENCSSCLREALVRAALVLSHHSSPPWCRQNFLLLECNREDNHISH
jgi:hypothetical protein